MNNYRITTNGIKFKVEKLRNKGILWWKKKAWVPIGHWSTAFGGIQFDTKEQAENTIEELKKEDAARDQGFIPMDKPPEFIQKWENNLG